jgi:hypothetical protein
MGSLRENPLHVRRSLSTAMAIEDDGTIGTMLRESTLQIPLPDMPTIGVFCTGKI